MGKSEYQKIFDAKKKAKENLYKKCWPEDPSSKSLVIIFAPEKNEDVLFQILHGCFVLPCNLIIVSEKEPPDSIKHPAGKITWVHPENGRNQPKIDEYLMAADMAVVFEEHLSDLRNIMNKGAIVIGHEKSPLLQDYHPNEETGNSFTYSASNPWAIFMALVRAHETFRFPYDWQNIMRSVLKMKS
jgi:hypothetical protein